MGFWIAVAVLLLLGLLPLGVRIRFNSDGFTLRVIAGPLKITVFPMKKKPKKKKANVLRKETEQRTEPAVAEDKPPQPPKVQPEKKNGEKGGSLLRFLPLVKLGLKFLGSFRRKLRLDNLYLKLILAGDDPCDLAVNYGRSWAAVGNLLPQLERVFVIKKRDIQIACDFTSEHTLVIAHLDITITLGRLLALVLYYGVRICIEFLAIKRKGGGAK